jgi:YegS/Rv2252/BmrU family lipid kinase
MRTAVIINPISGADGHRSAARSRFERADTALRAHGIAAEIFVTERRGHGRELAETLVRSGVALIIAWGGDGTINEIGSVLVHTQTALAIVPSGSGNGLAVELGIPRRPEDALAAALRGTERRIDAGELGGHLFFNLAGVGFDARIAQAFNRRADGRRGALPYFSIGLREVWRYVPARYRLTLPSAPPVDCRALLIVFANGRRYGGLFSTVAASARLDDGLLDVLVVDQRSIAAQLWRARYLLWGRPDRAPGVSAYRTAEGIVECDAPMEYHVDGEWQSGETRLEARVHAGALLIRAAAARAR